VVRPLDAELRQRRPLLPARHRPAAGARARGPDRARPPRALVRASGARRDADALQDAPPWPTPGRAPAVTKRDTLHGDHLGLAPAATLQQWLHGLATQDLQRRFAGCTIWWRVTEAPSGDSVDIVHGLPDGAGFAALLAGS
jgi:hypothetical protein